MLYEGLQDRLFEAPGRWNFKVCCNEGCQFMWLDPVPVEQEIAKAYTRYYTHVTATPREFKLVTILRKAISRSLSFSDPLRHERKRLSLMYLDESRPGKVLDVGCGSGSRLAQLRALGWDVYGQDVDPEAIAYARQTLGLEAHLGRLEDVQFPEMSFDCITLNHVIEHVHDPVALLTECRRILKKKGLLVVVTPNAKSFAHKHFGSFWRGLEPPRHIHLFSPKTLAAVAGKAGLVARRLLTTVANAKTFAHGSLQIRDEGHTSLSLASKLFRHAYVMGFFYFSMLTHARDSASGEECVLLASK